MRNSHAFAAPNLTESERLHRVAEILCNAIIRSTVESGTNQRSVEMVSVPPAAEKQGLLASEYRDQERVLRYLALVGEASPGGIRAAIGFSRSKTWRVLQRLTHTGRVVGTGQTRQVLYQLNAREPAVAKIGLN